MNFKLFSIIIFTFITVIAQAQYIPENQIQFQSTSTMQLSGSSYSSNPALSSDEEIVYKGPIKIESRKTPGTPGQGIYQQPVGDISIVCMFCFLIIYIVCKKLNPDRNLSGFNL